MADQFGGGRFDRVRKLGEGGMGSVWLAWDRKLERKVAIKQLRTDLLTPQGRPLITPARVLREARAISRLQHPNIVQILDLIENPDEPLLIMEYVAGEPLSEWIEHRPALLNELQAAEIGLAVLDALIAAHTQDVVHRDVKPGNILIRQAIARGEPLGQRVRLIDFGNAAIAGHQVTTKSVLVGSLGYMAPERFGGRTGAPSDLWSLGVTLYQAVERRLPFQRDQMEEVIHALLNDDPAPLTGGRLLAPVITGLLVKDPDWRLDAHRARDLLAGILEAERARRRPRPPRPDGGSTGETARTVPYGRISEMEPEQPLPSSEPTPPGPGSLRGFAAIVAHTPADAVALLRELGPRASAQRLDRLAAGSDEAVTVVLGVDDAFAAEMLAHARPQTAVAVLARIPADRAARLLTAMPTGATAPILEALPASDSATAWIVRALPPQNAARLLNDLTSQQVGRLLKPLAPAARAGVLGRMSPRRAAAVLDRLPADPRQAAALVQQIPRERVGAILDQMDARRVARILLVHPDRATRLLSLMGTVERHQVLAHLD
ncbi:Serine/threonine protein kinase [Thermomonospora echinospora]|uniref:non-specific serine/threonine protein kinase n=1 Tax=Thermomonospora echinospora TaxID=1992 RepID=A0A1H6DVT0_9ACTN|nr:protein kinase [Thermomonospora echinospora]SEG88853.1 Serine/threonine protein kinase [Thermomonospora echinospora]